MLPEFSGDFIQWLRGFYYTATCGSMTAAMKKMNRNQSALTYQIKSLEKEFGVKLFTGTKNNRVLTEEGKLLLTRASQIFSSINDLRQSSSIFRRKFAESCVLWPCSPFITIYCPILWSVLPAAIRKCLFTCRPARWKTCFLRK